MADRPTNRTKRSRQQAKSRPRSRRPASRRPASKPAVKGRPSATRTKGRTRKAVTAAKARKRRTVIFTVMIGLALAGFLFAFVYPTRTYLDQRQQIRSAEERLDLIRRETAELKADTERLKGDAEVERIAREQYGLVRPGETPYVIVPETTPTTAAVPTP